MVCHPWLLCPLQGRWLGVPLGWELDPFEPSAGLVSSSGLGATVTQKTEQLHQSSMASLAGDSFWVETL